MPETEPVRVLSEREFAVERTFHAPASRIFGAYTDPKILPQWWSPPGGTVAVERMDVRPGGSYRFVQRNSRGEQLVFVGEYLEVSPVTRLVYTFAIEGQGNEVTVTVDLRERDGETHAVMTNRCVSKEARDMMVKYGAEGGARAAWNQLAKHLATSSTTAAV
jgi:uncharacterized protein YndB with AHSA1/START domain